ncbi:MULTISPECIES: nickel pincer cofactor biosynthesis protein LarC [Prochlorococcus]|uniref:nickel pincer cofactor biosynthesis protein LarC n=1 Tax=Prochlorococcus TaxID=1218 RepID=UPI000533B475|nr:MULTISPECIES: nickel pincer cofactor biosynthesis protein LarC [Prochlorococcus]KGG12905.1 hypothetical protein EV05_0578 [Prochlorococcus sp. MIT 0601]
MKQLFFDCPTGLAGDMLLGSLVDLGVPLNVIESALSAVGIETKSCFKIQEGKSFGLRGKRVLVESNETKKNHRRWVDIKNLIVDSTLKEIVKQNSLKVFEALAYAESSVHGIDIALVEFHEIGSLDTLVDVIGVCAAIEHLAPERICCTPPPAGSGFVQTEHGKLPVPVPAVLELVKNHQIILSSKDDEPLGELTTPTGLALMIVLADAFSRPKSLSIKSLGIGLGTRKLDRPNLLRACLLEVEECKKFNSSIQNFAWQEIYKQESWIDDATPEDISMLRSRLVAAGAIEVVSQPIHMKKGRQGISVIALVRENDLDKLRMVWLLHGVTIGIRETLEGRWVLPRRIGVCLTPFGEINAKQVRRPNGQLTIKPEHDELVRISSKTGKTIDEIRNEFFLRTETFSSTEEWKI